ncbi:hypothetical protein M0D69_03720 [Caballeronia sp. SEWSISQ10-4 2]|uniref:hypothetical protein n=1 Tax=Caballeronia sp. SEWSISQ10-4 2 TaxID=2937438 RepID=UPI002655DEB9|nr:hypothetical protein [Caballeronia sp. SEWSISQ10-4 2]MDN7177132.1 hypothetical protein [Caballeronia sp. SEWSISQ10-4 2]
MNMHVSSHSSSGGSHTSTHGSDSPEPPSSGHKPSGSHGSDGVGDAAGAGAAAGAAAGGSGGDLNTQLQNFIVQVGQQILKSGQDGWANAKDDDDDG